MNKCGCKNRDLYGTGFIKLDIGFCKQELRKSFYPIG